MLAAEPVPVSGPELWFPRLPNGVMVGVAGGGKSESFNDPASS